MVLMNSASTAIDGIFYFAHKQTRAISQELAYRPNPHLLCEDNLAVNDFPNSGLNFIHFLHP